MSMGKTAIMQLIEEMDRFDWGHRDPVSVIKQFLPIERKQIEDAYVRGGVQGIPAINKPSSYGEQYYLQTFELREKTIEEM